MDSGEQGEGRAAQERQVVEAKKAMSGVLGDTTGDRWPPGLAGEGVCACRLQQSGQAVGGGFPISAEGRGQEVGGGREWRFQSKGSDRC